MIQRNDSDRRLMAQQQLEKVSQTDAKFHPDHLKPRPLTRTVREIPVLGPNDGIRVPCFGFYLVIRRFAEVEV